MCEQVVCQIKPGRGTTRNERLHRDLNTLMANCVEFSYALLTAACFRHNKQIAAKLEKRNPNPISAYQFQHNDLCESIEPFGLTAKQDEQQQDLVPPHDDTACKVQLKSLQYEQVLECLYTLSTPNFANHEDSNTVLPDFSFDDSLLLFVQAVSTFCVARSLEKMSNTADLKTKDIFFTSFLTLVKGFQSRQPTDRHNILDNVLSSWNFRRVEVPGDGNCLFTSIAHSLVIRVQCGDEGVTR